MKHEGIVGAQGRGMFRSGSALDFLASAALRVARGEG
jgi:hypothetical protein